MRYVAPIALGSVTVLLAVAGVAAARNHPASQHASVRPSTSLAAVGSFILPPHGIALWMHPTQAPITITVSAVGRLEVCEVGTTFSTYWRGGCRSLRRGKFALPSSGGAVHVGFWIRAVSANAVRVERLRVRWHCVDHFFLLQRAGTHVRLAAPVVFDC
jgi:hypothetical protein